MFTNRDVSPLHSSNVFHGKYWRLGISWWKHFNEIMMCSNCKDYFEPFTYFICYNIFCIKILRNESDFSRNMKWSNCIKCHFGEKQTEWFSCKISQLMCIWFVCYLFFLYSTCLVVFKFVSINVKDVETHMIVETWNVNVWRRYGVLLKLMWKVFSCVK